MVKIHTFLFKELGIVGSRLNQFECNPHNFGLPSCSTHSCWVGVFEWEIIWVWKLNIAKTVDSLKSFKQKLLTIKFTTKKFLIIFFNILQDRARSPQRFPYFNFFLWINLPSRLNAALNTSVIRKSFKQK